MAIPTGAVAYVTPTVQASKVAWRSERMTASEVVQAHYAHEAIRLRRERLADEAAAYESIGGDPRGETYAATD